MYSRIQIEVIDRFRLDNKLFWHLDVTGSIIKKTSCIKSKKPFFYYALVYYMTDVTIPIAEMISTDHTWPCINYWLTRFLYDLKAFSGKYILPEKIETDFSWPLLIAAVLATNRFHIGIYLAKAFAISTDKNATVSITTIIHICSSHDTHDSKTIGQTL